MQRSRMSAELKKRLAVAIAEDLPSLDHGSGRAMVADCVRRLIFEGHLRSGDPVPQEDLAALLGVSRIPVRDGLMVLEANGWIAMDPDYGAYVIGIDRVFVEDHWALIVFFWSQLIRRAIENDNPEHLARLSRAAKAARTAPTAEAMSEVNAIFLGELGRAANSPRVWSLFNNSSALVPANFFAMIPGGIESNRTIMPKIGHAIARRDADRAAGLVHDLHSRHARSVLDYLRRDGVLAARTTALPRHGQRLMPGAG